MRDDHPAAWDDERLLAQVRETRRRGSGPGGQRRNKVETAVRLEHVPSGIVAQAAERRSLEENRRMALQRLRLRLALEWRRPLDPAAFGPSPLWRRRAAGARLGVAAAHRDAAALLGEALDVLAATDDEVPEAAALLDVTPARLVRVLRLHAPALAALNARLAARGRRTWR